ncbi:MAG: tRNA pseudouridine(38-40) synthase TruA [Desulfobacterota bacterium]|nr:tRNA pseudouridine(38-40) synthase TruA [Thermodesulfobacteriota bacterium]
MRTIKLVIQFDGTAYHGWQTQAGKRTVQKTVQEAIERILNRPIVLHGAGRTDAGVHALQQVAHFKTDAPIDLVRLKKGLNSILPPDIAVLDVSEMSPDFHARYSARSRSYRYLIWNSPVPKPFIRSYAWHIPQPLNLTAMRAAARLLVGTHDFSAFQSSDRKKTNPVRTVLSVRLKKTAGHLIVFEIRANAFLKHMVRAIVGTLVAVGNGSMTVEDFRNVFEGCDRKAAGKTAPAYGLFLKDVEY